MSYNKNFLDLPGLTQYDTLIKTYLNSAIASSIKTVLISNDNNSINFYAKENATLSDTADFTISLNSAILQQAVSDISTMQSNHAGGTRVTLNGDDKGGTSASFYAPSSAGTSGQVLKSSGSGAPVWGAADRQLPTISNGKLIFS